MYIFMIRNFKGILFRCIGLLFVIAVLCFSLPPLYDKLSETNASSDNMTELKEPLRVEGEVNPQHLSAWFNNYQE